MNGNRTRELLHKLVEHYLDQEDYEVGILCLLDMGFEPIELIREFNIKASRIADAIEQYRR